jgi:hypothetical protein
VFVKTVPLELTVESLECHQLDLLALMATSASESQFTPSPTITLQEDCVTQETTANWVLKQNVLEVNMHPSRVLLSASLAHLATTVMILLERLSLDFVLPGTSALRDLLFLLLVLLELTLSPS